VSVSCVGVVFYALDENRVQHRLEIAREVTNGAAGGGVARLEVMAVGGEDLGLHRHVVLGRRVGVLVKRRVVDGEVAHDHDPRLCGHVSVFVSE
jgi:hypothetical protein